MTDQEIIDRVNASLADEFELDPGKMAPGASLKEHLGLDSLDTVDMVIVLERAFGFKIRSDEAMQKIRTLGDIHAFVIAKKRLLESRT